MTAIFNRVYSLTHPVSQKGINLQPPPTSNLDEVQIACFGSSQSVVKDMVIAHLRKYNSNQPHLSRQKYSNEFRFCSPSPLIVFIFYIKQYFTTCLFFQEKFLDFGFIWFPQKETKFTLKPYCGRYNDDIRAINREIVVERIVMKI